MLGVFNYFSSIAWSHTSFEKKIIVAFGWVCDQATPSFAFLKKG